MNLGRLAERLTAVRWTPEIAEAYLGEYLEARLTHAADEGVRDLAASGGAVSAVLVALLESGEIDGALVCRTVVEGGQVRPRYLLATTRDEILAARGSTYVLGDFVRDGLPLIAATPGRFAVVGLPCEIDSLRRRPELDSRVCVRIALFCGHASRPELIDAVTGRLQTEKRDSELTAFRFRVGHWRGRLQATFADGTVVEKPSSYYNLYQNLYVACARKCLACGDHFGYQADLSMGDIWAYRFKDDPVKHTAVLVKTETGQRVLESSVMSGHLISEPLRIEDVLDGQRRVAPFHFNTSARARVGARLGMCVRDTRSLRVRWHEQWAARIVMRTAHATQTEAGVQAVLRKPRRLLKLQLLLLKGLESIGAATPRHMVIAIIAATVWGNRGAEAMLEATIGRLRDRWPDARFIVYSYYPERDRELIDDPAVTVRSATPLSLVAVHFPFSSILGLLRLVGLARPASCIAPAAVRDLARADALVDLAGVSFIDGREKFLPFNVLSILPAMLLGVPVFKLSQAVGPFRSLPNKAASRLLYCCKLVVPRGDVTLGHLQDVDFPAARTLPAPDTAFAFEPRDTLSREGEEAAASLAAALDALRQHDVTVVGLCPSSVIAGHAIAEGWDYPGMLAKAAEAMIADGYAVVMFPNATRASSGDRLRNNDLPIIRQVMERLGDRVHDGRVLGVNGDMSAGAIRSIVERCDCAAVSRFHAMVGALSVDVPVLVLGWSHKYLEVMAQFGLEEWAFDYSDHDPDALIGRLRALVDQRLVLARAIAQQRPAVRDAALAQFDTLCAMLTVDGRA
ncbi:MAG: Coenzyme F420 hydrogenase/dehydrogenase, beta subunit C-terminal domain [Coriobacteriia bacterium]|nr:Coenzyme F420 hydrogenase/dehydrogenase, beta subunit C-terminal domain [Coriobacteriia bacterium]